MRKCKYPRLCSTVGKTIRKKRMDKGITLKQFARDCGITESYLCRIENDLQSPTLNLCFIIASKLNGYVNYDSKNKARNLIKEIEINTLRGGMTWVTQKERKS